MADKHNSELEVATLGGGCFWCIEAVFDDLRGVTSVESGYSGGHIPNPSYEQVCSGNTGHAEVIQVTFDRSHISYEDLLKVFFTVHDPTSVNRQGADVGAQYRSVIFYHDDSQKETAERVIRELDAQHIWPSRIVTQVVPFEKFYIAEDYHQEFFANNPFQPYCNAVIAPKVAKFRKQHADRLKRTEAGAI